MKRIVCFHLFNDYSGSPKVLKIILSEMLDQGISVDLVSSTDGALDELKGHPSLRKSSYRYAFSNNAFLVMLRYIGIQIWTFLLSFRYLFSKNTFYINTLLPVGPALAGRLMGKRVVYHYHENATVKGAFYKILCACMQRLASEIICVSAYQRSFLKRQKNVHVIPNALPTTFTDRLTPDAEKAFERKKVLMLGSLKLYKGTLEFIRLAQSLPQYPFELVINDTQKNIAQFLKEHRITKPDNLNLYPRQDDVVPFYNQASLVLNLSNKDLFVETFGLTAIEAMSAGLPVIVPTTGGIAEMVEDDINGYKIDAADLNNIKAHIQKMFSDKDLYLRLSENALKYAKNSDIKARASSIIELL